MSPFLEKLANETQSSALLGLISADQIFVVAKHEGNRNTGVTIRFAHRFHITAQTGFSQDTGGLEPGINVVNAPIFGPHQGIMGCLILIGTFCEGFVEESFPEKGLKYAFPF